MQINIPTDNLKKRCHTLLENGKRIKSLPKWSIYLIITIIVLIIVAIVILHNQPKRTAPIYPTVEAQPVIVDNVELYGEYAGKIKAKQYVEVRARVEGYLEKMHFQEGKYINKNDILL